MSTTTLLHLVADEARVTKSCGPQNLRSCLKAHELSGREPGWPLRGQLYRRTASAPGPLGLPRRIRATHNVPTSPGRSPPVLGKPTRELGYIERGNPVGRSGRGERRAPRVESGVTVP